MERSQNFVFALFGIFLIGICSVSCEPDLKEVDRIASIQAEEPVDISRGVRVVFSDSALVKAELTAPEMRSYQAVENPYYEFPAGIKIIFFDEKGGYLQDITADYAVRKETEEMVEFRNNVVITRADGFQIFTDELIHNEKENVFYNHAPISGRTKDGQSAFQGSSFHANGDFTDIIIQNTTGNALVPNNSGPGN